MSLTRGGRIISSAIGDCVSKALSQTGILGEILGYVGPGHWLHCALVNKAWYKLYKDIPYCDVDGGYYDPDDENWIEGLHNIRITCEARHTLYSAVFASSTSSTSVRHASGCGLRFNKKESFFLQSAAGMYADYATLLAAHRLGMPWQESLVNQIALSGDLAKLKRVWRRHKYKLPSKIDGYAAASGNVDVLEWLYTKRRHIESDAAVKSAARFGHLNVLQYLYKKGYWDNELSKDTAGLEVVVEKHIQIVKWLFEYDLVHRGKLAQIAAVQNAVAALECMINNAASWDSRVENRYESDELLNIAGAYDSLDACKWLRDHGADCL
jgi:hypothetical protein